MPDSLLNSATLQNQRKLVWIFLQVSYQLAQVDFPGWFLTDMSHYVEWIQIPVWVGYLAALQLNSS